MKNSIIKIGMLGVFLLLFSSGNAQEKGKNQKPPSFKELLEQMDKNEDGKLSKEEVKGPIQNDFEKIDTDEDGFITEEELKKAPKPKRPARN
tara:strand:- start:53762 stop:54037 length:276 start_codon:yes stop_codon:yes gene_type:complete